MRMSREGACSIEGCERPISSRRLCNKHYHQERAKRRRTNKCACGCGEMTEHTYKWGHHTRMFPREEQSRRGRMNDGSAQRERSEGKTYRKVRGRHEHRVVAEQILGRPLRSDEVVHHKNGDMFDNRPANLEVMSRREHIAEHRDDLIRGRRNANS